MSIREGISLRLQLTIILTINSSADDFLDYFFLKSNNNEKWPPVMLSNNNLKPLNYRLTIIKDKEKPQR